MTAEPIGLIHWTMFPEEFVVQSVFDSSLEFRTFYEAERSRLEEPIVWARDPSLPEGIDYRCTRLSEGVRVIRLRRVPAVLKDAAGIAQQLEHFILDSEGFPTTGARMQFEFISSALNSMIHGPIVFLRLDAYGFDVRQLHEQRVELAMRQLGKVQNAPSDHLETTHWVFNYVAKLLEWEVVSTRSQEVVGQFQSWFDLRFPSIAAKGRELVELVNAIGCNTPDKQATLFRKIIDKYQLGEIIFP